MLIFFLNVVLAHFCICTGGEQGREANQHWHAAYTYADFFF